jgi:hypothetical protein
MSRGAQLSEDLVSTIDLRRRHYEPTLERLGQVHAGLASSFFDLSVPPLEVFLFSSFRELLGPIGAIFVRPSGRSGILVVPKVGTRATLSRQPNTNGSVHRMRSNRAHMTT